MQVGLLYFFEYATFKVSFGYADQSDACDLTELAAFSIGSGSVKVRKYDIEIIRFSSGSLFAILKNTVQIRLRFDKIRVKPVYKTPVWVRFDSLVFAFGKTSKATLHSFEKSCCIPEAFRDALVKY